MRSTYRDRTRRERPARRARSPSGRKAATTSTSPDFETNATPPTTTTTITRRYPDASTTKTPKLPCRFRRARGGILPAAASAGPRPALSTVTRWKPPWRSRSACTSPCESCGRSTATWPRLVPGSPAAGATPSPRATDPGSTSIPPSPSGSWASPRVGPALTVTCSIPRRTSDATTVGRRGTRAVGHRAVSHRVGGARGRRWRSGWLGRWTGAGRWVIRWFRRASGWRGGS